MPKHRIRKNVSEILFHVKGGLILAVIGLILTNGSILLLGADLRTDTDPPVATSARWQRPAEQQWTWVVTRVRCSEVYRVMRQDICGPYGLSEGLGVQRCLTEDSPPVNGEIICYWGGGENDTGIPFVRNKRYTLWADGSQGQNSD